MLKVARQHHYLCNSNSHVELWSVARFTETVYLQKSPQNRPTCNLHITAHPSHATSRSSTLQWKSRPHGRWDILCLECHHQLSVTALHPTSSNYLHQLHQLHSIGSVRFRFRVFQGKTHQGPGPERGSSCSSGLHLHFCPGWTPNFRATWYD